MQTVLIGKKHYSVGLWWQTLEQGKSLTKEARALARSVNKAGSQYDGFALRRQVAVSQAGFGQGFKKAMSLAATLADSQSGSWLARFEFSTGVWVVAVVDDTILPNGDFFGPVDEAHIVLRDLEQMGGWDRIINPGSIEDSMVMLEQMVRQGGRHPMVPVKPAVPWIPITLGLLVLTGGVVGQQMYARDVARRQAEERAAKMAAFQQELAAKQGLAVEASAIRPWEEATNPATMIAVCRQQMSEYPLFDRGWELKGWVCDGRTVVASWQRTSLGSFETLPENGGLDLKQPESLQSVKKLEPLSARGAQDLTRAQESVPRIYEFARVCGANVSVQWAAPAPTVTEDGKPIPPPSFEKHGWTMASLPAIPDQIGDWFDGISGLVVQNITWDPANGWSLKGDIYVR